ncbi:hypothetical protein [Desulfurivibrio dismutans]|uniref:hypothetical protein n=1 Tax=Desulfurivibrio dismutans TaxID=1398908 RepID=UPI0023DC4B7E|nr:hypothetical protein [Desulfurivibrio alkaliphilus]MDF1615821.1 hypothetical protein [Desulfurivibrio alkaliphilus]
MQQVIDSIIGIAQSFFVLGGAWWGWSYYSGRLKFSGEAEQRRIDRVEKYGTILMLAVIVGFISGSALLVTKAYDFAKIIMSP